ncbi:MAG: MEKHLA domain-containing protein [Calothrix sp. MO_167.B42]|nr:MEKHLA domain-containing protein [Calothrix sp. MO_167.B42]
MNTDVQFPWQHKAVILHTKHLLHSYQHWIGQSLFDLSIPPEELAQALFTAPFVVVSHGTQADPIFNYGNQKALDLWELDWEEFTQMPSRKTAQEVEQAERNRLLLDTQTKGFSNFSGIRITSTGKRFYIEDGIIWNILDENNQYCGQGAVYSKYRFV